MSALLQASLAAATDLPEWVTAAGLLGALAFGLASAFFPPLNAEAFALAAPLAFPGHWVAPVAVMTVGLMAGKSMQFLAVRHGSSWWSNRRTEDEARGKREGDLPPWRRRMTVWTRELIGLLDRPWAGAAVVFSSGAVGFPPLAMVTLAAGARRMPWWRFGGLGVLGCLTRFLVTAWVVAAALG